MRFGYPRAVAALVVASGLTLGGIAAAQAPAPKTPDQSKSPQDVCMNMMQGPGATEQGKQAMREFMQSPKAGEAMTNMMDMAKRMGNGDPMLGMTKMMEMMGGQGGMMDGQATPGTHQPKRDNR